MSFAQSDKQRGEEEEKEETLRTKLDACKSLRKDLSKFLRSVRDPFWEVQYILNMVFIKFHTVKRLIYVAFLICE